jgi:hypothetical protein
MEQMIEQLKQLRAQYSAAIGALENIGKPEPYRLVDIEAITLRKPIKFKRLARRKSSSWAAERKAVFLHKRWKKTPAEISKDLGIVLSAVHRMLAKKRLDGFRLRCFNRAAWRST